MTDIVQELEDWAASYEQSGPSAHHTASLLRKAKWEIEFLRRELSHSKGLVEGYKNLAR